jgi:hypothetical protein
MRFKVLSVLIAATSAATLADAQTGETWATYRGNPARTGSDGQTADATRLKRWGCGGKAIHPFRPTFIVHDRRP